MSLEKLTPGEFAVLIGGSLLIGLILGIGLNLLYSPITPNHGIF